MDIKTKQEYKNITQNYDDLLRLFDLSTSFDNCEALSTVKRIILRQAGILGKALLDYTIKTSVKLYTFTNDNNEIIEQVRADNHNRAVTIACGDVDTNTNYYEEPIKGKDFWRN